MDEIKYRHIWNEIDERFNSWCSGSGAPWESQVDFLTEHLKKNFKLSSDDTKKIFKTFHGIYRTGNKISFNWEKYQLPTLIAITSNYVKFK